MSKSLDAAREQVNPILIDTKLQAPLLSEGEGLISRTRLVESSCAPTSGASSSW
jgi:hypothetical protein